MDIAIAKNGTKISVLDTERAKTHTHIIGASGFGKSKLLENMIRQDIGRGNGLCVIDWHGTLYHEVVKFCAKNNPPRPVILLDLSKPDFLLGFNPFSPRSGDISTQVENRIQATVKPWGMENTDQTPRIEKVCRTLFHFLVEANETLYNASSLLRFDEKPARNYAIQQVKTSTARELWTDINNINTPSRWQDQTDSTTSRLLRFIGQEAIKVSTSLRPSTLDVSEVLKQKAILLVNLSVSEHLSMEAAGVYAALLLNEFFEAAMRRASDPPPPTYYLYLDEFQEYITNDMANMLDQARKGGLHLIMAHQRMGHLYKQPEVLDAVLTNAKIRVVFGGLRYGAAAELAQEMKLHRINERQIVETFEHLETKYVEETREILHASHSHSESHGSSSAMGHGNGITNSAMEGMRGSEIGGLPMSASTEGESESDFDSQGESSAESDSASFGVTVSPFLKPVQRPATSGREVRSREEKVSWAAESLIAQKERFCVVKVLQRYPEDGEVPFVEQIKVEPTVLQNFIARCHKQSGALPFAEAQQRVEASKVEFQEKVKGYLASKPPDPEKAKRVYRTKKKVDKS